MMREMDFVDEYYADKDLSLLKKLTLVIPTYNRNYYLSRCLWYHAHFPFGEIIVADSSPEEKKVVNRETVQKIREKFGANVRYLEYEPETEKYGGDIYRKWGDAVQHVETEYSQICTDKEFEIPTTSCQMICFLDKNPDYAVADGSYYYIEVKKGKSCYYHARENQRAIPTEDPSISLLLSNYCNAHPLLSIHRTKLHKSNYEIMIQNGISTLGFGEISLELLDIMSGKYYHASDLCYLCRDLSNNVSHWGIKLSESSYSRYPSIYNYGNELFQKEYDLMQSSLLEKLERSGICRPDIDSLLSVYLPIYLAEREKYSRPLLLRYPYLSIIWMLIPQIFKKNIQKHIDNIKGLNSSTPSVEIRIVEIEIITNYIKSTMKNHKFDKIIDIV